VKAKKQFQCINTIQKESLDNVIIHLKIFRSIFCHDFTSSDLSPSPQSKVISQALTHHKFLIQNTFLTFFCKLWIYFRIFHLPKSWFYKIKSNPTSLTFSFRKTLPKVPIDFSCPYIHGLCHLKIQIF